MTKRIVLSIAVLLFVAGGVWIACNETTVAPPAAPSATTADRGWTDAGSETSASEVTLNPTLVASQRPSRQVGYAAVLTQIRLEGEYGQRWDEVAALIRAIAVLKGLDHRVGVFNEMLDPLKIADWKTKFPIRSTAGLFNPFGTDEQRWEKMRQTIRAEGGVRVPVTYGELQARRRTMTEAERTAAAIQLLTEYVEMLKSDTESGLRRRGGGGGGAMLWAAPVGLGLGTQLPPRCENSCEDRADELLSILMSVCYDEYHACCGNSCRRGNARHRDCSEDFFDCKDDARDVYREWMRRCEFVC